MKFTRNQTLIEFHGSFKITKLVHIMLMILVLLCPSKEKWDINFVGNNHTFQKCVVVLYSGELWCAHLNAMLFWKEYLTFLKCKRWGDKRFLIRATCQSFTKISDFLKIYLFGRTEDSSRRTNICLLYLIFPLYVHKKHNKAGFSKFCIEFVTTGKRSKRLLKWRWVNIYELPSFDLTAVNMATQKSLERIIEC